MALRDDFLLLPTWIKVTIVLILGGPLAIHMANENQQRKFFLPENHDFKLQRLVNFLNVAATPENPDLPDVCLVVPETGEKQCMIHVSAYSPPNHTSNFLEWKWTGKYNNQSQIMRNFTQGNDGTNGNGVTYKISNCPVINWIGIALALYIWGCVFNLQFATLDSDDVRDVERMSQIVEETLIRLLVEMDAMMNDGVDFADRDMPDNNNNNPDQDPVLVNFELEEFELDDDVFVD